MSEWGTPIMMMLGKVKGPGCGCSSSAGLGDPYSRALPAGSVAGAGFGLGALPPGMGPEPWAAYPGSGGPNRVVTDLNGQSPDWRRNTITTPIISPDDPQNRQRVFNGGLYNASWDPRTGQSIRGYGIDGLGNLVRPWASSDSFTMGVGALPAWAYRFGMYNLLGGVVNFTHGYVRNKNVGWALLWGACGFAAPLFTTAVAIVQGLGKSKSSG